MYGPFDLKSIKREPCGTSSTRSSTPWKPKLEEKIQAEEARLKAEEQNANAAEPPKPK